MGASAHLYLALGGLFCLASPTPNAPSAPMPAAGEGHRICWQEGRRLQWSDFCAKTVPKSSFYNSDKMGAISSVGVSIEVITENGRRTYRVDCVFVSDSSWVNNKAIKTNEGRTKVLIHEQLHFDIAELKARKLRWRIAQGVQAGEDIYGPQATQDITRLRADDTLDNQLDTESISASGNKVDSPIAKRWQLRLARELHTLVAYKSMATNCH